MLQNYNADQGKWLSEDYTEILPAGFECSDKGHVTEHPWHSAAQGAETFAAKPAAEHGKKHEKDHA